MMRRRVVVLALLCHIKFVSGFSSRSIISLRDGSANDVLRELLQKGNENEKQLVHLEGFVSKRRAIGKSLVFLDIIPSKLPQLETHQYQDTFTTEDIASMKPVQALMRRDVWKGINANTCTEPQYDVYQKIIQPGVYCSLIGEAGPSRLPNEALLFCHSASYKLPNNNPQHLRNVIRFARDGLLDLGEACAALPCIHKDELLQMLRHTNENRQSNQTNGECAAEILSRFPNNFLKNPSKLMGNSNSAKVALLPPVPDHYKLSLDSSSDLLGSSSDEEYEIGELLKKLKHCSVNLTKQYIFSGFVQNRRRFQNSVTVVEVVERFSSSTEITERISDIDMTIQSSNFLEAWNERIHVVIDPNSIGSTESAEMYGNILATGSQVLIQGYVTREENSKMTICWVLNCRLLHSSWKLNVVRLTLELLHKNKIDTNEAADALQLEGGYAQAEEIANGSTSSEYRQWMAAEISRSLQGEHSRYGKISPQMTRSLERFEATRDKFPIEPVDIEQSDSPQRLQSNITSNFVPPVSRWERAKKPQLKWMIGQISSVLESHPEFGQRALKVIDIGGGKGLLSNFMAETFGDKVEVHVVDISRAAINNGAMKARRRGIQNVSYQSQDASTLNAVGVDVVIALHACGALSDVALGHAVCNGAAFVICPW